MKKGFLFNCLIITMLMNCDISPKTNYPLTHFMLNLLGPICILQGTINLKWYVIPELKANWNLILAGSTLIALSRVLRYIEKKTDDEETDDDIIYR